MQQGSVVHGENATDVQLEESAHLFQHKQVEECAAWHEQQRAGPGCAQRTTSWTSDPPSHHEQVKGCTWHEQQRAKLKHVAGIEMRRSKGARRGTNNNEELKLVTGVEMSVARRGTSNTIRKQAGFPAEMLHVQLQAENCSSPEALTLDSSAIRGRRSSRNFYKHLEAHSVPNTEAPECPKKIRSKYSSGKTPETSGC